MTHTSFPRLLGDIGGTHARFAWQTQAGGPPTDVATYLCAQQNSLLDAVRHYLAEHGKPAPRWCGIGIANPITGDRVQMTNHHWSFSISDLQRSLALERLVVINDFTALALALADADAGRPAPDRRPARRRRIARSPSWGRAPGWACRAWCRRVPAGCVPITGEGGHVSLAAADAREAAVVERLKQRFGHPSAERALSGPGLVNLYEASCALAGRSVEALGPADVIARARGGNDPCCVAALELFFGFLGSVAGNLALTLGARGGLYIGGGIAPRVLPELERSAFRERFEAKGRFRDYLAAIPTWVIHATVSPAFAGVARALDMP